MTIQDLFARWLARQDGRATTLTKYRDTLQRAAAALGPERAVDTVTGLDVDTLFGVTWSGLAGSTLSHRLSVLKSVWRYAHGLGVATSDPVAWYSRPRRWAKDRRVLEPLAVEEARRLLEALDRPARRWAFRAASVSLYTGLRKANVVGPGALAWEDVDLLDGILRLPGGRMKSGRPLEVPIARPLLDRMWRWADSDAEGGRYPGPVVGALSVRHAFAAGAREALGRPLRFHELRATFATWLETQAYAPRGAVKVLLGHAGGDVTDLYVRHVQLDDLRKWVDRLPPVYP